MANQLGAEWKPLAASLKKSFAAKANVIDAVSHWTDSISHGELLCAGYDERMEVDPANLKFLFQGVADEQRTGKKYGEIPWQLGLLESAP